MAWIRKLLATHLFVMGQYERAMEHFAKLSNDPLEVIGLYQNFLPKPLRDKYDYPMEIPVLGTFSYLNRHLSLSSANLIFRISFSPPPPSPNHFSWNGAGEGIGRTHQLSGSYTPGCHAASSEDRRR